MPSTDLLDYDRSAPLDLEVVASREDGGVVTQDIAYASPRGGKVPAYLVEPVGEGLHAGVVYMHWGQGTRDEFLDEAREVAPLGIVSLLVDAPHNRPEPWKPPMETAEDSANTDVQLVTDLLRGFDLLAARPTVDAGRLGYVGHSLGATRGAILPPFDSRIKTLVLMAGYLSMTESIRTSTNPIIARARQATPPATWNRYLELAEPLDAVHYIGEAAPASLLFQFARQDEFISAEEAQRFFDAASEPKTLRWYDGGHAFSAEARRDRIAWLRRELPA